MGKITFDYSKTAGFISEEEIGYMSRLTEQAKDVLVSKNGAGNDFLGWIDLPVDYDKEEFSRIEKAAEKIKKDSDVLIVIGIGGSYLGARAAIEFLRHGFYNSLPKEKRGTPEIYYVGNSISSTYLQGVIDVIGDRDFSVNVISKSGTTTEPAIAFRIFKKMLEDKYGQEEAAKRIYATTDKARGALKDLATKEGYESFVVPDDVGGRFSVLTPVGLLPIAIAGFDIEKLVAGAVAMEKACGKDVPFAENPAAIYAATRNELYKNGKKIEILVNYNPKLHYVSEWWKQLYGESEGKENKGIFPAAVDFSTDLHSMGQWIQEGERTIYETVISVEKTQHSLQVPSDEANLDGLNFLAGKHVDEVNKMAELGTQLAHVDGGVPNMRIVIPALNEESIGGLLYFFEIACGISGYILGVNPFNQPGVEAYKKNMFALLNKPGYEEESKAIQARL
jgi:glucose-6-phosphate isomerase